MVLNCFFILLISCGGGGEITKSSKRSSSTENIEKRKVENANIELSIEDKQKIDELNVVTKSINNIIDELNNNIRLDEGQRILYLSYEKELQNLLKHLENTKKSVGTLDYEGREKEISQLINNRITIGEDISTYILHLSIMFEFVSPNNIYELIKYLLKAGANVNSTQTFINDIFDQTTPLHIATSIENIDNAIRVIKLLIEEGANINAVDISNDDIANGFIGQTPFEFVYKNRPQEEIDKLKPLLISDDNYNKFVNKLIIDSENEKRENYENNLDNIANELVENTLSSAMKEIEEEI